MSRAMMSAYFSRRERGATLLEFAIILPLFLFLLFAIIDFSQIISRHILITQALARAARTIEAASADVDEFNNPTSLDYCLIPSGMRFIGELQRQGIPLDIVSVQKDAVTKVLMHARYLDLPALTSGLSDFPSPNPLKVWNTEGILVSVRVKYACILCPILSSWNQIMFRREKADESYLLEMMVPMERKEGCSLAPHEGDVEMTVGPTP